MWDPAKAERNFRRHKVSFDTATRVFEDPFVLDVLDDREDHGEERWNAFGMIERRIVVVTYTLRRGTTRIISARLAEPHEKRRYHEAKR